MRDSYDVAAVGGGPDALVAAAYLADAGRTVLVVGEQGQPGGIAANVQIAPGFQFPVFPETLPSVDPAVALDLDLGRHGLELVASDPVLTAVGPDGIAFTLPRDLERARLAIAGLSARDAARFPEFVAELGAFGVFLRRLLDQPPLQLDASLPDAIPAAFAALGLGAKRVNALLRALPMPLTDYLNDWFESDSLKAALAGSALTGTRLGHRAPGTAGLFLHFHAFGHAEPLAWIRPARGGSSAVGRALREAASAAGAHLESESGGVRRIATGRDGVTGVELLDGLAIACDMVVSDAAPGTTLLGWTGAEGLSPDFVHEVENIRYRGTAARVGLALSALPHLVDEGEGDPRLGGVVQIGARMDDLERAADAWKYGRIAAEPLVFACFPSVHESGLTPDGGVVLAATVQSIPQDANEGAVLEATLTALERAFPGIRNLVTASRVLTPRTLERGFGLIEGSFYQGEPTMDQFYSLRPVPGFARHRTPVAGLYLAGPGTYPYGGLHGVSGRNAARAVTEDLV
ncbi:MAG: NAD(P)/FAD-dependent oxidoreductase [Acidobacteria bacterium]|nr:NAD(P)/FAD-dependent oxidoreductase [Acidobacteriota bacterium]MYG74176.1 NAD(P)/FAD-dependent oxidoreductase [Acidobacteriota bacterium]